MKKPEIRDLFVEIDSINEINGLGRYEEYCLTGGEPMLYPVDLLYTASSLHKYDVPIYIYSNIKEADRRFMILARNCVDGFNFGVHQHLTRDDYNNLILLKLTTVPFRLLIRKDLVDIEFLRFTELRGVSYKIWEIDDCLDKDDNDRFLLRR